MLLLVMIAFALTRLRRLGVVHLGAWLVVHKIRSCTTCPSIAFHARVSCGKSCLIECEASASHHRRPRFTNHIAAAICTVSTIVLNMIREFHNVLSMVESAVVRVSSRSSHCALRWIRSSVHHSARTDDPTIEGSGISILSTSHHSDIVEI